MDVHPRRARTESENPDDQFIEIWNRAWTVGDRANRDMFAFINASLGAPWLTDENARTQGQR